MRFFLYFERYWYYMCTEIEYAMILEMLQKKQKEQKKLEKPIEVLVK